MSAQGVHMPDKTESPQSNIVPETRQPEFAITYLESILDHIHSISEQSDEPDMLMKLGRALAACTTALFNAHRILLGLTHSAESNAFMEAMSTLDPYEEL